MQLLDIRAGLAATFLVLAIAILLVRGDQVGVQVVRATPLDRTGPGAAISLQFSEPMDRESVTSRLHVTPSVPGEITWAGSRLLLRPGSKLDVGQTYVVELDAGATSASGRRLLTPFRFGFRVVSARVAYLYPEDGPIKNIWARDAAAEEPPERLTTSAHGVVAFDVTADGARIAYAERGAGGAAVDLRLLDMETRSTRALTSCGQFICTNPVWSPDGTRLAYERLASSTFEPGLATTSSRVWLLEPDASPPRTWPLLADPQTPPNYKPRWSPNGRHVAISQLPAPGTRNPGITIVALDDATPRFFPTNFGSMGVFAPDGDRLAFPNFAVQEGEMQTILQLGSLNTGDVRGVPGLTQAHEAIANWAPDGGTLVVARRATSTDQFRGRQLYRLHPESGQSEPLLIDPGYDHAWFSWDPTGRLLVLQRGEIWVGGPELTADQRTQIWVFDPTTHHLTALASNAYAPRWLP